LGVRLFLSKRGNQRPSAATCGSQTPVSTQQVGAGRIFTTRTAPPPMTLQAEIQKRQQAVSDLKRQAEQISALAGEDKKAGIRVADALRKRKVRASLKDVKIRNPADSQRRLANSADI
jgi:hypothetical protein